MMVIDDDTPDEHLFPKEHPGFGLIPRDYSLYPSDYLGSPTEIQVYSDEEISERIKDLERDRARLSDIRGDFRSYNQKSDGYCWAYSTTAAFTIQRMTQGPFRERFSAHSIATVIKNGRNEGGWCGLSADFIAKNGVMPESIWPSAERDLRYNTHANQQIAKKYRVTEGYYDFSRPLWDQKMTQRQVITCLLNRIPVAADFYWWGHSVCLLDVVEVERGSFGFLIWNSWGDTWGDRGMGVIRGNRAIPDGAIAVRSATVSLAV